MVRKPRFYHDHCHVQFVGFEETPLPFTVTVSSFVQQKFHIMDASDAQPGSR